MAIYHYTLSFAKITMQGLNITEYAEWHNREYFMP